MLKSLRLQADMMEEFGACVFDVTLDCEDGAPGGGELEQANMVVAVANAAQVAINSVVDGPLRRVGARLHPVGHPSFASDVEIVVGGASRALSYIMIPKVESRHDVDVAVAAIDAATEPGVAKGNTCALPVHVLIESPAAVAQAFDIASHPRVESLSFGLMDFVSTHAGAISSSAMGVRKEGDRHTLDQFHHPLVVRAKLEISSACHAYGKVPSHCVVTEFRDAALLASAAQMAAGAFGYTRMWSIHPDQIRPIVQAFSPSAHEIALAADIIDKAATNDWAPISVGGTLHDRASYRYFWQVLERGHQTGAVLPSEIQQYFASSHH